MKDDILQDFDLSMLFIYKLSTGAKPAELNSKGESITFEDITDSMSREEFELWGKPFVNSIPFPKPKCYERPGDITVQNKLIAYKLCLLRYDEKEKVNSETIR